MFLVHDTTRSLSNLGGIMSKSVIIDLACEKCLKVRRVDKWCHGKLCKQCSNTVNGIKRKGEIRPRKQDLTGQVFGQLTALSVVRTNGGHAGWLCTCSCGKQIKVASSKLLHAGQRSCGCHKLTQGGWAGTHTYKSWGCMIRRCTLSTSNRWHIYGGRGITVCDRWLTFLNFLEDMGERPQGFSLDRIDNDKGYYKENCRWISYKDQARNKRNNYMIEAFGQTLTSAAWSEQTGLKRATIEYRIKNAKWSPEKALREPVKKSKPVTLKEY